MFKPSFCRSLKDGVSSQGLRLESAALMRVSRVPRYRSNARRWRSGAGRSLGGGRDPSPAAFGGWGGGV